MNPTRSCVYEERSAKAARKVANKLNDFEPKIKNDVWGPAA